MPNPPLQRPPRQTDNWETDKRELFKWFDTIWRSLSLRAYIPWNNVDKAGSNLTEIETRNHNDLQFGRDIKELDYDIQRTDDTIFGDATAGSITITLPTAVGADEVYVIKKIDASANVVTIAAQAGETVALDPSFDLEDQGESLRLESDGSGWYA